MKLCAYSIMLIVSMLFFSKLGAASGCNDRKKKKALWLNALAFIIGFLVGMLIFL